MVVTRLTEVEIPNIELARALMEWSAAREAAEHKPLMEASAGTWTAHGQRSVTLSMPGNIKRRLT